MGHIVLAPANLARCHLHQRLLRALRQRGHRASVLGFDPVVRTFWRHHDHDTAELPIAAPARSVPIAELASAAGSGRQHALAMAADALFAWFEAERPDLVLLHQDRNATTRIVQFVARAVGCRVLWTGDGLLPHTLQLDERGLDGDAGCAQRAAAEFRVVRGEPDLLRACLANALAQTTPFGLPRAALQAPPLRERLRDVVPTLRLQGVRAALASCSAWRQALPLAAVRQRPWQLPAAPYVAVLLQADDDARVRLDADAAPTSRALVHATAAATERLGAGARVVVVATGATRQRTFAGHALVPADAGPDAAATALATVTINHPLASVALLASTPVLHLGRALYGVRGVATKTTLATLANDLTMALGHDYPTLRERFLTWVFGYGHLWCSPNEPDYNGMLGLVNAIEARLGVAAGTAPALRYRPGPAWPLLATGRGS